MRILIALLAGIVVGCGSTPGPEHYEDLLDALSVPASWELAHTDVRTPDSETGCSTFMGNCPRVSRTYLVPGDPVDIYPVAKRLLTGAAFAIGLDTGPECDTPPSASACAIHGDLGEDTISVSIFNPGEDPTGLGIADEGRSIVLVGAYPK